MMLIAVAFVAVCLGAAELGGRATRYSALADDYNAKERNSWIIAIVMDGDCVRYPSQWAPYYAQLRDKYRKAARYPWLPVEPDPPRPSD